MSICYLSIYVNIIQFIFLFIFLSLYLSICLSIHLPSYISIYLSIYLTFYLSIHIFIYPSIYLPIDPTIFLTPLPAISFSPLLISFSLHTHCKNKERHIHSRAGTAAACHSLSRFSAAFSELLLSFRIKFGNFAGRFAATNSGAFVLVAQAPLQRTWLRGLIHLIELPPPAHCVRLCMSL